MVEGAGLEVFWQRTQTLCIPFILNNKQQKEQKQVPKTSVFSHTTFSITFSLVDVSRGVEKGDVFPLNEPLSN